MYVNIACDGIVYFILHFVTPVKNEFAKKVVAGEGYILQANKLELTMDAASK